MQSSKYSWTGPQRGKPFREIETMAKKTKENKVRPKRNSQNSSV
jgi:hypothetical protein